MTMPNDFTDPLPDLAAMTQGDLLAWLGTSAVRWARTFAHVLEHAADVEDDPDALGAMLIGWFANAIETGRTAGRHDIGAAIDLVRSLTAVGVNVTGDLDAARRALDDLTRAAAR